MFGKKTSTPASPISDGDRKLVIGLIWALKPSDLSTLLAMQQMPPEKDFHFATSLTSGHSVFWRKLVDMGMAHEKPAVNPEADYMKDSSEAYKATAKNLVMYAPTPAARKLLTELISPALTTGWPPKAGTISPEAVEMLNRYANDPHLPTAQSQSKLACLYEQGNGVEKNPALAVRLYKSAAEKGDTTALNNLGVFSLSEKNPAQALLYFMAAAEKGSVGAMDNVGEMHGRGIGMPKNLGEAFKWFHAAASHGHPEARFKVGDFYAKGLGIPQDFMHAYIWYKLALKAGFDTTFPMEAARAKLTQEQLTEAEAFISQWAPKKFS